MVKREVETPQFQFRVGVEADYFDETIDTLKAMLAEQPLDYVIGAVHYSDDFPIDCSKDAWDALPDANARHHVWEVYLGKIQRLCGADFCDFIAHIDLPKKFGEWLPADLEAQMEQVLQMVVKAGLPMEINTAGLDKPCQEWYPSDKILHRAIGLGIPLLVNADAHATAQVVRHFSEARAALRRHGVTQVCEFSQRHRKMIPLD